MDAAWVIALMMTLEPKSPHRPTFERTAEAIARRSEESPLFAGEHGAEKTAALVVSVAWFESSFIPDAEGDCDPEHRARGGTCARGRGRSLCLLQVAESNLRGLGTSRDEVLSDVDACVAAGLRMMRASFGVCRARPLEERLAWYAAGSEGCTEHEDAVRKSRHRVAKGMWLYRSLLPTRVGKPTD